MHNLRNLLSRYGVVAWRRRWYAIAIVWAICIAGWAAVASIPNQYQSTARLYVDTGAVLTPLLKGLAIDSATSGDVDILQRTLLSRPNLEKLISKTDLDLRATTRAEREALIQSLTTSIRIQPQTRNLFTIEYTDRSARLARDVVQTIVTLFIESATGNSRVDMEDARQFLERQIVSYEAKLRAAEQARAAFQVKYSDVLPGSAGASRVDSARDQAQLLAGQVIDATARRDLLKQEMATTPPLLVTETDGGGVQGGGGGAPSGLAEAERALRDLQLRYTDRHPDVVAARERVASLRGSGGGGSAGGGAASYAAPRARSVPNPVFEQLKIRLLDAESALASLRRQATDASEEEARLAGIVRGAPGIQAEYINLNRDYDVLRKNYDELLARRESMRIGAAADEEADKVKLRVVDAPQVPSVPIGPKRLLLTVGVLLAGFGGGVGLVVLLVQLDTSFYSVQDLRGLGRAVLGGVSMQQRREPPRRLARFGFAMSLLLLIVAFGGVASYPLWLSRFV